jgi:hypothetical protein
MKVRTKRKVSLLLSEEEVHVISAGLFALSRFKAYTEADSAVAAFANERYWVREGLVGMLWNAGLCPRVVCNAVEREAEMREEQERLSQILPRDRSTELSTWSPEERGLLGITGECEDVLQILLNWAWRHPERWVSAKCSRSSQWYQSQEESDKHWLDKHWFPHIDFLLRIGRITPKTIHGEDGWIVPSAKDWRKAKKQAAVPTEHLDDVPAA